MTAARGKERRGIASISNSRTAAAKVFLEFEGMRQSGEIFLNGKSVGLSENGVTAYGVDITDQVKYDGEENVLAVHVDNRGDYAERATGVRFEWNVNDFNPNFGGINRHVRLHVTGPIYQTLPLYDGLKTTGVYVYPMNIAVREQTADVDRGIRRCITLRRKRPAFPFRSWSWTREACPRPISSRRG